MVLYLRSRERKQIAIRNIEAWLSLVERCVRDAEVAGSNPVASIIFWLVGQAVKTPPSHGGNRGSIPLRAIKRNASWMHSFFVISKCYLKKECALAHSRAERGRLRHISSSRERASTRSAFCFIGNATQFPIK